MPDTQFIETAGQRLAYVVQGSGPPLVIVHGIGGRKEDWFGIAAGLAGRHTIYLIDMIGFGESSKDGDTLTIGMQAEAILALLDSQGLATADIAGNSLGGWVAAVFAARYPGRIGRLAVIDAAGLTVTLSGPPPVNFVPDSVAEMQTLLRTVIESPFAHTEAFAAEALAGFRASGVAASLGKLFAGFADPASSDRPLDDVLPAVRAPALVMWGEHDRLFPLGLSDIVAAGLPGCRRLVIPGGGHFPHIDNPDAVIAALAAFLA
jgi:triacylglycerol lipase